MWHETVQLSDNNAQAPIIVLGAGPPVVGCLLLTVANMFRAEKLSIELSMILMVVMGGYIFMGLQSLVMGLVLEFVVLRYATTQNQVVAAGVLLGALAGSTLIILSPVLVLIGAGVGLLIEWVNRRCVEPF